LYGDVGIKLISVTHYGVCMTLMISRRSPGQRSRSSSGYLRNLVYLIAPESLKKYEPKFAQIYSIQTDYVFKVIDLKVKVAEKLRKHGRKRQRHAHRLVLVS